MKIHELAKEFGEVAKLRPDLVLPKYGGEKGSLRGHCYILTEALWFTGGRDEGWKPAYLSHTSWPEGLPRGEIHWYLRRSFKNGDNITFYEVCDPTAEQFDIEPPHWEGRSCGFQTKHLSKRAESLLSSVLAERLSNNLGETHD